MTMSKYMQYQNFRALRAPKNSSSCGGLARFAHILLLPIDIIITTNIFNIKCLSSPPSVKMFVPPPHLCVKNVCPLGDSLTHERSALYIQIVKLKQFLDRDCRTQVLNTVCVISSEIRVHIFIFICDPLLIPKTFRVFFLILLS